MFIGYCVPTGLLMKKGGGIHQWNVQLREFIKLLYVRPRLFLTKISCINYPAVHEY